MHRAVCFQFVLDSLKGQFGRNRRELQRRLQGPFLAVILIAAQLAGWRAPARADPTALWRIVHGECVPHFEAGKGPGPCERVDLSGGEAQGVAILKDLVGVAQMLAIPTRRITGIEDPQMLAPDAPKVFAAAWGAKALVEARLHVVLPRQAVAIAINSKWARSQDQFHLHVDCVARTCRGDACRLSRLVRRASGAR